MSDSLPALLFTMEPFLYLDESMQHIIQDSRDGKVADIDFIHQVAQSSTQQGDCEPVLQRTRMSHDDELEEEVSSVHSLSLYVIITDNGSGTTSHKTPYSCKYCGWCTVLADLMLARSVECVSNESCTFRHLAKTTVIAAESSVSPVSDNGRVARQCCEEGWYLIMTLTAL